MTGLAILGLIVAGLALLDVAAVRWGVDTRPGFDGSERTERMA